VAARLAGLSLQPPHGSFLMSLLVSLALLGASNDAQDLDGQIRRDDLLRRRSEGDLIPT
jgi:hypothetical protein